MFFICLHSCENRGQLTFEPVEKITREWITSESCKSVGELFFVVSNYYESAETEIEIDEFYCSLIDSLKNKYDIFFVTFFKETKLTNKHTLENGALNPSLFEESSIDSDRLWRYTFQSGSNNWGKYQIRGKRDFINKYPDCLSEKYPQKYIAKKKGLLK